MGGVSADLCLSGVSADAVQLQRVFAVNGLDKICSKYDTLACAVDPSARRGIEWSYSIQRAEVTLSAKTIKGIHCIHCLCFSWCKNIWSFFASLPFLLLPSLFQTTCQPISIWRRVGHPHPALCSSDFGGLHWSSPNGNVYADGHICRTINLAFDCCLRDPDWDKSPKTAGHKKCGILSFEEDSLSY